MKELEELERLANAATPGLTESRYVPSGMPVSSVKYGVISSVTGLETCRVWERRDVEFYAAASPDVILSLIRELKITRKALERAVWEDKDVFDEDSHAELVTLAMKLSGDTCDSCGNSELSHPVIGYKSFSGATMSCLEFELYPETEQP